MVPTISDVAKDAGVSKATVSRVLNGKVAPHSDTYRRVRRSVKQLGYTRLRRRSQQRTVIACVYEQRQDTDVHVAADHHLVLLRALQMHGTETDVEIVSLAAGAPAELRGRLNSLQVEGVILMTARIPESLPLPAVSMNQYAVQVPRSVSVVDCDDVAGLADLLVHLRNCGHRRIAFFGKGSPETRVTHPRLAGLPAAFHLAGVPFDPALMLAPSFPPAENHEQVSAALDHFLALPEPPTALMLYNDVFMPMFYTELGRRRLHVPDDLSIVGFDDQPIAAELSPGLTTVRKPLERMAAEALHLLQETIQEPQAIGRRVLVRPELIVRDSVRDLNPTH